MTEQPSTIVQRLWNYCNVLRDDGVSYGDYVEQLTYLLFLKMDDEQAQVFGKPSAIPADYSWDSLRRLEGTAPEAHYREALQELGTGSGLIPVIFRKAQNRIQDPAKLRRLIMLIDEETWSGLQMDWNELFAPLKTGMDRMLATYFRDPAIGLALAFILLSVVLVLVYVLALPRRAVRWLLGKSMALGVFFGITGAACA